MRVSDTMYYRIIKNADLATQSLDEGTTVRIRLPALTAEEAAQLQREEEP